MKKQGLQCLFKTFLLKLEEEISQKRYFRCTLKLGDKERLDSERPGKSEPFILTNLPVYFINIEQPGVNEQFCDDQKVPYHQV